MRISKASLVSPGANQAYGTFALAISFFVFAYSSRFGQASILVYYALWLPLVLVDYRSVLGNYGRYIWILAFAVFACLSVFWSAAPGMTARTGVQYLSHVVCALIAMRTIDIRTLVRGATGGRRYRAHLFAAVRRLPPRSARRYVQLCRRFFVEEPARLLRLARDLLRLHRSGRA